MSLTGKHEKVLDQILRGTSDSNISFSSLCQLLEGWALPSEYEATTIFSLRTERRKYLTSNQKDPKQSPIRSSRHAV
jgi:hypothetical protein